MSNRKASQEAKVKSPEQHPAVNGQPDDRLDLLVGTQAIADFRGESLRQTQYLIRRRAIPFYKQGATIVSTKSALRADVERKLREAAER